MARPPAKVDLNFFGPENDRHLAENVMFNRQPAIANRKSIDSLASRSLALSGLPVHFAVSPTAQLTHLPPSETRIGNSSIMNCVLPRAPIMRVPVAAYHFFDMLSPVWHPQLLQ